MKVQSKVFEQRRRFILPKSFPTATAFILLIISESLSVGFVRAQGNDPTANFQWNMEDRAIDLNGDGLIDSAVYQEMSDPCYLNPEGCGRPWIVDVDASSSTGEPPLTYSLTSSDGGSCQSSSTISPWLFRCSFAKQDTYGLTLTVTDGAGRVSNPYSLQVDVKDLLIVSVGDSLAAGEGNPDVPGSSPTWQDGVCHRSAKAASALAALAIEKNDPHTSVTFLHLGCSGASINEGLIGYYEGQEPCFGVPSGSGCVIVPIPPQIDEVARRLCPVEIDPDRDGFVNQKCPVDAGGRSIDDLIISIGINDVRFGDIARLCSLVPHCTNWPWNNFDSVEKLGDRLGELVGWFDDLNRAIQSKLNVSRVFVTEYPDNTRRADGSFCHMLRHVDEVARDSPGYLVAWVAVPGLTAVAEVLNSILSSLNYGFLDGMTSDETGWAFNNLLVPLNKIVFDASAKYGWVYMGGVQQHFYGHGMCAGADREFVLMRESIANQGNMDGTLHPNNQAHREISQFILTYFYNKPPTMQFYPAYLHPLAILLHLLAGETPPISQQTESGWYIQKCTRRIRGLTVLPPDPQDCDSQSIIISVLVSDPDGVAKSSISINGLIYGNAPEPSGTYSLDYYPITDPNQNLSYGLQQAVNCSSPLVTCNFAFLGNYQSVPTWVWFLEIKASLHWDLRFTAYDSLGVKSDLRVKVPVDLEDPIGGVGVFANSFGTLDCARLSPEEVRKEWLNRPVCVSMVGYDAESPGQVSFDYKIDAGPVIKCPVVTEVGTDEDNTYEVRSLDCPSLVNSMTLEGGIYLYTSVSGEGIHRVSANITDLAGRSISSQTTVKIDETPPTILGALDRQPDHNGWYNHPTTITWTGSDSLSGLASCDTPTIYSGPDATSITVSGHCTDVAGNMVQSSLTVNYDSTPPDTTILSVIDGNGAPLPNGGQTLFGPPIINFDGSDAVSGVSSFECTLDNSSFTTCSSPFFGGTTLGAHAFKVKALDIAGNADPTPGAFTWTIITPAQSTQNLITSVSSMNLANSTRNSLLGPLNEVLKNLSDKNPGNDHAVCSVLKAFVMKVDKYKTSGLLTPAQAVSLKQQASDIAVKLGCT